MDIENNIFKRVTVSYKKLISYGFNKKENLYEYKKILMDNLEIIVSVLEDKVSAKVIDLDFNEEYTNFRLENQNGSFTSHVREKFINVLEDIKDKCFIKKYCISNQGNRICELIKKKYDKDPVFKFENNDSLIFENNSKWFGIIMNVDRSKFSNKTGETEIINIKLDKNKVLNLLKHHGFYKAYHMNKKSWITITLDDTISDKKIMDLIDESYSFTIENYSKSDEWVMPINPGYFDVFTYFDGADTFYWDIRKSFKIGDVIYMYITKPVGCIMYKCLVENITEDFMIIKKLCKYEKGKYSLEILKKYGLTSVRSFRHIPLDLKKYIEGESYEY